MKHRVNQQKILAAENRTLESAKQMIESPMWFIEQILLKHEQAVLEVCKELYDDRDALIVALGNILGEVEVAYTKHSLHLIDKQLDVIRNMAIKAINAVKKP